MRNLPISKIKVAIFGTFLLGYSACSSSTQEKDAAYQTIRRTLGEVCSSTRNMNFNLSRDLLFCGQNLCVDNTGLYLPKPGEKCPNDQRWGTRYDWPGIKIAHSRPFREGGCVDLESVSVSDKSYSPPENFCSIFTPNLQQAKSLADAINVYID